MKRLLAIALVLQICTSGWAEEIKVLSWNVESGGSDAETIADQLAEFADYDLLGLSEVQFNAHFDFVVAAATDEGAAFEFLLGNTGGNDRLLLIWNADRFEKLDELELLSLKFGGGRAPIAVKLRESATGHVFWFMVNHLYRGNTTKRNKQAKGLREWIRQQDIPVLAVGDYNLDYQVPTGPGNQAFNIIRQGGHVLWIEPEEKMRTEDSHNSILDFVFVNDAAAAWEIKSRILVLDDEFEPEDLKADHRPLEAIVSISEGVAPPAPVPAPLALRAARSGGAVRDFAPSLTTGGIRRPVRVESYDADSPRSSREESLRSARAAPLPRRVSPASAAESAGLQSPRLELIRKQLESLKRQIELLEELIVEEQ